MINVELLPHNETGYKKLIECLKEHNIATINHATGTGKTFILLKYILQHQKKRIMFMAPTYPIIDQLKNEHIKELNIDEQNLSHMDHMIYPNLLKLKSREDIEKMVKKYDVFILDEYHRCGSKQWGKVINTIKEIIKEKYPQKKIIGTTATEIRYLDSEKNMKDLLFDGVEASRLDLVDAILQGILPVPSYYNFDIEALDKINNIKNRVKKYIKNEKELAKIIEEIDSVKNEVIDIMFNNNDVREAIKPNSKYLVFSATLDKIKEDSQTIRNLIGKDTPIEEYVIHSGKTREENSRILELFRRAKKTITSVLYSINILKEGVHVTDVDGEFQCRKTASPILYFQFIGRVLSYSQRKKQVKIFDLANNLTHHKAILNFYDDLISRAEEILKTDPDNRICNEIINKLKIVDKTVEVNKLIDSLNQKYSKINLINKLLNDSIKDIEKAERPSYIMIYKAEGTIKKFYKYIDLKLFERIKKQGILKDQKLFQLSIEEFKKLLKGYDNLHDLLNKKYVLSYQKIKKFMSEKYRIPSLFSNDSSEVELAKEMSNNFEKYNGSQRDNIRNHVTDEDTMYEQILYRQRLKNFDYEQLIIEIEYIIKLKIPIKQRIIAYLKKIDPYSNIIDKIKKYNEELLRTAFKESIDASNLDLIEISKGETSEQTYQIVEELIEKYSSSGVQKMLEDSYQRIIKYIEENKEKPEYVGSHKLHGKENNPHLKILIQSRELYLLEMILNKLFDEYGYTEKINQALFDVQKQQAEKVVEAVLDFIEKNENNLPNINSPYQDEVTLAIALKRLNNNIPDDLKKLLDRKIELHNQAKEQVIDEMYKLILRNIGKPIIFTEADEKIIRKYGKFKNNFNLADYKKIKRAQKISELFYFIVRNRYEFPSKKNNDSKEQELASFYGTIRNNLIPEEQEIFKKLEKNLEARKIEFIKEYQMFIKNNGRLPVSGNADEVSLQESYNRISPYLTDQEKQLINNNPTLAMMRNAFADMLENQTRKGSKN